MQKTFNFFYALLLAVLGFGATLMAEDITLTTYYPAPYGAYNEMSVSQAESTDNTTSALIVASTDDDTTAPVISASAMLNGMLLDTDDESAAYYILNVHSGATSKFYVRNDGNVGIGNDAPTCALDVTGTVNATAYSAGGTAGYSGTFFDLTGKIVTVTNGIITSVN